MAMCDAIVSLSVMKTKLEYHENLDGLRGISAMMIVVFHFYTIKGGFYSDVFWARDNSFWRQVTSMTQHGVSLFFVLSGFLITRILLKAKSEDHYLQTFYLKRLLRIAPLYYLFLIIWFYVLPLLLGESITPVRDQLPGFLYVQNIWTTFNIHQSAPGHFWSLAIEEHFYLAWPMVVYFMPFRKLPQVIGITIGSVIIINYAMVCLGYDTHDFTLTRVDQILMGALLCTWEAGRVVRRRRSKYGKLEILLLIPLLVLIYAISAQVVIIREILKYTIIGAIFLVLIAYVLTIERSSPLNKILTNAPMQYFGRISYGIYVWHPLVLILMFRFFVTTIIEVDLILAMLFTIIISHISYFYFEVMFLKMKSSVELMLISRSVFSHDQSRPKRRRRTNGGMVLHYPLYP
jgi:peptidoglycan/LPS O-acetylase OafA/YrhL